MANGKGSARRPAAVDDAKVRTEWDRIFPKRRKPFYCPRCGYEAVPTVCTKCGWVAVVDGLTRPE